MTIKNPETAIQCFDDAKDKGMQIEFTFAYSDTWSGR